jgi:hypothetical protein
LGGRLIFKVFDEDTVKDELIGSIHIEIKDIIGDKNGKFDWKNIYGAPMGVSGKNSDLMNANPEVASFWKGRILMQCIAEETEKPLLLVQQLEDDEIQQGRLLLRPRKYAVSFFVAGALAMPENDKEYEVSLRIADKEWNTGLPQLKKPKFNRFNVKPTETDGEFIAPYYNIQDIGTIILYLKFKGKIGKEKRICYKRLNIMEFLNPNPELRWLELDPDLAIGEVKDHFKAGVVGIKLSIHDIENDGPINWLNFPQWSKRVPKRPPNLKVRVFCWQARDLPAADDTGSSDPFIQITDCDRS